MTQLVREQLFPGQDHVGETRAAVTAVERSTKQRPDGLTCWLVAYVQTVSALPNTLVLSLCRLSSFSVRIVLVVACKALVPSSCWPTRTRLTQVEVVVLSVAEEEKTSDDVHKCCSAPLALVHLMGPHVREGPQCEGSTHA